MQKQSLNKGWRFYHGEIHRWFRLTTDDSSWPVVDLPHDWSIALDRKPENPSTASNGFFEMGRGRYHKTIDVPEEWRGKKVMVEFEGVYMNAEFWMNDNFIDRHPYGYTSFLVDLTPYLKYGEPNLLKVAVDNSGQMNSRWYSGSGIYRPAWLIVVEPVHVAHWGVFITTPEVSAQSARALVRTRVVNETAEDRLVTVRSVISRQGGAGVGTVEASVSVAAGQESEVSQEIIVANPALWSPDSPALYQVDTTLEAGGKVVDTATTPFGIRSIAFSAEQGFVLNGQPLNMKGGCVHHDNGVLGAASYRRSEERKVELLKTAGYNAIRCAHNPPAPAMLDACDRLGILVIDESFDCWREGKNPFDYHLAFDDWWKRDVDSMVLRDRNHPSIVIWSIGNEVIERDGRSNGAGIAHMLASEVHRLDPTRPVTAAINGVHNSNRTWVDTDAVFSELGVGGYNYQWQQYRADHERHPQRIMAGTESFPMEAYDNWKCVEELPYVIGDFVWTSMDYLGEAGIGRVHFDGDNFKFLGDYPWHQAFCGDIDICGFKRPQSYYRDMLWGVGSGLYIAVHAPVPEGKTPQITRWGWPDVSACWNWPGGEGQTFKVEVYSASDQVELFLNGKSLGTQPAGPDERHTAAFEVPYEPGELKAVGFRGGLPCAESTLKTAGAPAAIRLNPDRAVIQAGEGDLCYVTAEIVDAEGCLNPQATNNVFFTVQGVASILAVGSGNPTSTERYTGNQRMAHQGICLVVVKPGDSAGEIRLRANADGLDGAEIVIRVS